MIVAILFPYSFILGNSGTESFCYIILIHPIKGNKQDKLIYKNFTCKLLESYYVVGCWSDNIVITRSLKYFTAKHVRPFQWWEWFNDFCCFYEENNKNKYQEKIKMRWEMSTEAVVNDLQGLCCGRAEAGEVRRATWEARHHRRTRVVQPRRLTDAVLRHRIIREIGITCQFRSFELPQKSN